MIHLTVIEPFGKYGRGAHITDADEVAAILAGENSHHVVQRYASKEHASGDFYKSDAELAKPAEKPAPVAKLAAPADKAKE